MSATDPSKTLSETNANIMSSSAVLSSGTGAASGAAAVDAKSIVKPTAGASAGASSGAAGEIEVAIDLTAMPAASPPFTAAVVPGETWYFQWWHRDVVAGPTANLSNAIAVSFH